MKTRCITFNATNAIAPNPISMNLFRSETQFPRAFQCDFVWPSKQQIQLVRSTVWHCSSIFVEYIGKVEPRKTEHFEWLQQSPIEMQSEVLSSHLPPKCLSKSFFAKAFRVRRIDDGTNCLLCSKSLLINDDDISHIRPWCRIRCAIADYTNSAAALLCLCVL